LVLLLWAFDKATQHGRAKSFTSWPENKRKRTELVSTIPFMSMSTKPYLSKLYHLPRAPPWDHAFNIPVFEDIQDSNHSNHHLSLGEDGDAA
jgi:hypothetical protein